MAQHSLRLFLSGAAEGKEPVMLHAAPRAFALDDLALPKDLAKQYPALLSPTSLQHLLRQRNKNGLAACCVRLGKKIAISRSKFEAWIASRAEVEAS